MAVRKKEKMNFDGEKWTKSVSYEEVEETPKKKKLKKNTGGGKKKDNLKNSTSNKRSGKGKAEKKHNSFVINNLEGELQFIVTKDTIKIKVGDTIRLKGLGKYLSGSYYVKEVSRQISSSGYSHSAILLKTNFGETLKPVKKKKIKVKKEEVVKEVNVSSTPTKKDGKRTYTVKKGDCLWLIAKKYYGNGRSYGKIYDANTGIIVKPSLIYTGQILVIP